MARSHFRYNATDDEGNAIQNAKLLLQIPGTTDPVTDAWSAETAGVPVTYLITNNQGEGEAWFDSPQEVQVSITDNGDSAYYPGRQSVTAVLDIPADDVALLASANAMTGDNDFSGTNTFTGITAALDGRFGGRPWVDVAHPLYGAVGDGITDDTTAIQAALATGATVLFGAGTFVCSALTLTQNYTRLLSLAGRNRTTIKAKAATDFSYLLTGTGLAGVEIEGITFDANQANRLGALTGAANGVGLTSMTDCSIRNCGVTGTIGPAAGGTSVGIAVGGSDCSVVDVLATDCGTFARPSDGVYVGPGDRNTVALIRGHNVTDTLAVLEGCNLSSISNVKGYTVGCVAAITSLGAATATGNSMSDILGYDWRASSTGGINIRPTGAGNLTDTRVTGVTLIGLAGATGPAFNAAKPSSGAITGLYIDGLTVQGAGTQGILLLASDVTLDAYRVTGTGSGGGQPIQVQSGSARVKVGHGFVTTIAGQIAVYSDTANDVNVCGLDVSGAMAYGVYFAGTATGCKVSSLSTPSSGISQHAVGADAGTTPLIDVFGGATPEAAIPGALGSVWHRIDGSASTSVYIKESVAAQKTGWVAK